MPDASTEFEQSIYATKEAIAEYEQWLYETLDCSSVELTTAPQYADFDYFVYVDQYLHHYLEVKTRRHNGGYFRNEKMPIRKHAVAAYFMREDNIKTIYLVSWIDQLAILELWKKPDSVDTMVARLDRGSGNDIYAMYDYERFKLIKRRQRPKPPEYRLFNGNYERV